MLFWLIGFFLASPSTVDQHLQLGGPSISDGELLLRHTIHVSRFFSQVRKTLGVLMSTPVLSHESTTSTGTDNSEVCASCNVPACVSSHFVALTQLQICPVNRSVIHGFLFDFEEKLKIGNTSQHHSGVLVEL